MRIRDSTDLSQRPARFDEVIHSMQGSLCRVAIIRRVQKGNRGRGLVEGRATTATRSVRVVEVRGRVGVHAHWLPGICSKL
jgi:hypothetical protein